MIDARLGFRLHRSPIERRPYKNYDYAGDRKIVGVIRSQPDPKAFVRETGRELPSQRLIEPSKGSVKKFMESLILAQD